MLNTNIILSYLLIIIGIMACGVFLTGRRKISPKVMEMITTFGGAFLFASCFINLVPHMYLEGFATPGLGFKVGATTLIGFLIQLLLERLTHGIEHGHNHNHSGNNVAMETATQTVPVFGLLLGLCIHSFLEGMPMVEGCGHIHYGLLWGIVLHNIPIALVLVTMFIHNRYSIGRGLLYLFIFAVMTPLGSLTGLYLFSSNAVVSCLMMGVVVGILLHVSISILFDHDHNKFSWGKLLLIVLAFVAAYFTPGCPEIYG